MERLARSVKQLRRTEITVGVHGEDASRPGERFNNVQIAAVHEYGAPERGIPQRSFIGSTMDAQQAQILDDMNDAVDQVLQGQPIQSAVERVGIYTEERVRETIRAGIKPALSPATIERRRAKLKGGAPSNDRFGTKETPLIDTGQLIQSVSSVVKVGA